MTLKLTSKTLGIEVLAVILLVVTMLMAVSAEAACSVPSGCKLVGFTGCSSPAPNCFSSKSDALLFYWAATNTFKVCSRCCPSY